METTELGTGKPKLNRELIESYLETLKQKYEDLAGEPFNTKARIAVRKEIEDVMAVLEENLMDSVWASLEKTFGMESTSRPKSRLTKNAHMSSFRSRMTDDEIDLSDLYDDKLY